MSWVDYLIFGIYFITVLSIGFYFYKKNKNKEDYFVGGREISASHVGLSIVATDVGGGFSIGLGGLGFLMGLSGSWLLFTGLVGAWSSAIIIIPKIKALDLEHKFLTYPDFLKYRYSKSVAITASIISGIGYLGFTSAQILAGAKLAAGSVFSEITWMSPLSFSIYLMAGIILFYTVLGGLKAVIYTDTLQWFILFAGLMFFGIPAAYIYIGGWEVLKTTLPATYFTLTNISWVQIINWFVTIIPVWFVAMTLYQRIYACRDKKEAQKAFFIAGLLEYPIMAFTGVILGLMAKVAFPHAEAEMAMPMLLKSALPVGISGIVLAAYFSAIMSTADSCLIAASANWVHDLFQSLRKKDFSPKTSMRLSQLTTLVIGLIALLLSGVFPTVLEIILYTYAFMVSGLLVPTLTGYFWKRSHPTAALLSMITGGTFTLILIITKIHLPYNLDPSLFGIALSAITLFLLSIILSRRPHA